MKIGNLSQEILGISCHGLQKEARVANRALLHIIESFAQMKNATKEQIALAWVLAIYLLLYPFQDH